MLYRYKKPADEKERADRLQLLQHRGDRGIFKSTVYCTDWKIPPTFALWLDDLEPITEEEIT